MQIRLYSTIITVLAALLMVCSTGKKAYAGDDYCDIAKDIARRAVSAYKTDPKKGLKLFLKAYDLCQSRKMAYNLGIAFYKYGNTIEAQKYLEKGINASDTDPVKLNNLASVMLENRQQPFKAVEFAEKALKYAPDYLLALDTLARAQFAAGKGLKALKTIEAAAKKYPSKKFLEKTRKEISSDYIAFYLAMIKTGKVEEGLKGLENADFIPSSAFTYCHILKRVGMVDKALEKTSLYQNRFHNNKKFKNLHEELIAAKIKKFYLLFQQGDDKQAVRLAKNFKTRYPASHKVQKAYDDLVDALTDSAATIEIPETTVADAGTRSAEARIDNLMDSIGSAGTSASSQTIDLTIDVEKNIPLSIKKKRYAVALLIGNQKYARQNNGLPDVDYAGRDVDVMAQYIEKTLGYMKKNIIIEKNITKGDFNTLIGTSNTVKSKLSDYIFEGKTKDIFIYYAGHGSPGPKGNASYLVPVDAAVDYIENNGYPLNLFYNIMEKLNVKNKTIVIDACFSGGWDSGKLFKGISPASLKTAIPVRDISNAAIFCAADKDQVAAWYPAKRHSLFTYFFFKGLKGEADFNKDKIIRLKELDKYLKEHVQYWAKRVKHRTQTPLVRGDRDFVVAELK